MWSGPGARLAAATLPANPRRRPSLRQTLPMIPLICRYIIYYVKTYFNGKKPIMDFFKLQEAQQIYGCPIGGIGTGSIGRGFRGEFCRFQLRPGIYDYITIPENQFIVNIKDAKNSTIFQSVLSTYPKPKNSPSSWEWKLSEGDCEYTALYPQAWMSYDLTKYGIILVCKQISPIIPHNYKDSSLPCAVFKWDVKSVCDEQRTVSISFTFRNITEMSGKSANEPVHFERYSDTYTCGVSMEQKIDDMPCTFTIAKKKQNQDSNVDGFCKFNTQKTAEMLWNSLYIKGRFIPDDISSNKHTPDAMGLSSQVIVEARSKDCLEFSLVWDMPVVHFGNNTRTYNRYYTKFFGNEGIAGPNIATYALSTYKKWETAIEDWQRPIMDDKNLPDWYKNALMNELYYISDGGTVWFDVSDQYPRDDPRSLYGMFGYLEGHEYRMYNTYDVHFYASFALAQLWPHLQVSLQYQFKDTVAKEISTVRKYLLCGTWNSRKTPNSIPHDLGDPEEEPFIMDNSYNIHDVGEWRDLNLKFILQVFRDYTLLKSLKQQYDNLDRYQSLEFIDEDVDEEGDLYIRSTHQDQMKMTAMKRNSVNMQNKAKMANGFQKHSESEIKPPKPRVKYISVSSNDFVDDDMTYSRHASAGRQNSNPFVFNSQTSQYNEAMTEYETEVFDPDRYLRDMYPVCRNLISRILTWDKDDDGLIENMGAPDQTYDAWIMTGPSSYCGGMWLAVVQCMHSMATLLGIQEDADKYKSILEKGKKSFESILWNGKYYEFDATSDTIMADQLCGQWYLRACGFQHPVFPKDNVNSALKMVFDNNVMKFKNGQMGAVNGFVPPTSDKPGEADSTSLQSQESWTGVTYGLAALMIHEGMTEEGFKTAGGMYNSLMRQGMQFQTPEALYENGEYRSLGYMRPLSIWAMQYALNNSLPTAAEPR